MAQFRGALQGAGKEITRLGHRSISSRLSTWNTHVNTELIKKDDDTIRCVIYVGDILVFDEEVEG